MSNDKQPGPGSASSSTRLLGRDELASGEHVEMAIRAAQVASTLLGLLECRGIAVARLRFVMAVKQLKKLDDLLTKIEERPNTKHEGRANE